MKAVDVVGVNIDLRTGSPLVLLRELEEPHRLLALFVGPAEAASIGLALGDDLAPPRPLTHDLMMSLIQDLDAEVDHVEVTDLVASTFVAEVHVRTSKGEVRVDSRPSDAIALALRADAPVFASESVLDEAGAVLVDSASAEAIDQEIDRFREFLNEVDPNEFGGGPDDPPQAGH